ncbi:LysE family translocator [Thalassospira marina]|uniref:Lysine transporter LysE n=1 Tax=Thalassospira marina TaxID=2048283 RepID=A0A2N3KTI3_9PROT|nr:LysE family translocator [Thalassospira marina]PKR53868.1 hypothetical protein COO20_12740 [Thalassospira marina]
MSLSMPYDQASILTALATYIVGAASPGLGNMAIASTSVQSGRMSGFAVMFGVLAAGQTWALCAAAGLSSILLTMPSAMHLIGIVGGMYLVWLAFKTFKNKRTKNRMEIAPHAGKSSTAHHFRKGFFIQILNPKAVLGWILIISIGVRPDSPAYTPIIIVLCCLILGTIIFSSYVMLFSLIGTRPLPLGSMSLFRYAEPIVYFLAGSWLVVDSLK